MGPHSSRGVEDGNVTAATWQWYSAMDAALREQNSSSQSLLLVANMSAAVGAVVGTPTVTESERGKGKKRAKDISENLFDFLKEQAEREEQWQRETLRREEKRQRAESHRAERFLKLFEKLVNKF